MSIEKIRPSFTFTEDRLAELRSVVPEAFPDSKLDWDLLREALGDLADDAEAPTEHYGLNWPGKQEARRLAAKPSHGTLVPVPGEGANEDTTHNLYIEGENLEVLKLLQKAYAGRVKMIYIDPPYNTGADLIYKDDYSEPLNSYLTRSAQTNDAGELLTTNPKSSGRFHTNWLNMIYPRLRVARTLLTSDGVIFVSTDDNEIHNLRAVMNEIFGEENHLATFIWNTSGHTDNQLEVKITHEYVVCYRNRNNGDVFNFVVDPNTTSESNLWRGYAENSITKNGPGNPPSEITLPKGFPCAATSLRLAASGVAQEFFDEVAQLRYISRSLTNKHNVTFPIRLDPLVVENSVVKEECRLFTGWANANKLRSFINGGCRPIEEQDGHIEFFLSARGVVYYRKTREGAKNILSVLRNFGTTETARSQLEAKGIYFSYPKPVELIRYLCKLGATPDSIVLDFYAGSGTTGEAILSLNAEQSTSLSFILVQAPEPTKAGSLARQHGFNNISEICRARLRAAACDILGSGFRVFRLSNSSIKRWKNYEGNDLETIRSLFDRFESQLVDEWSFDGLLTEVMLLEGFPIDSKIEPQPQLSANTIRVVSSPACGHHLWTCFDATIQPETLDALELPDGDVFVCLDNALDDNAKLRLSQAGTLKTI